MCVRTYAAGSSDRLGAKLRQQDLLVLNGHGRDDVGESRLNRQAKLGAGSTLDLVQIDGLVLLMRFDQLLDDFAHRFHH